MSYEVTYKGHQRIDDTGKPYYVNEYTESYTVPTQYKVFFTLSLFCGFRKGETLALHWNDIDLREKKISISKSVGMTENLWGIQHLISILQSIYTAIMNGCRIIQTKQSPRD